ncbi:MAG: BMC domain-containing protein [Lachnospirales bacterium]
MEDNGNVKNNENSTKDSDAKDNVAKKVIKKTTKTIAKTTAQNTKEDYESPKLQAIGMIETIGFVASIEAADAMVKSANVEIVKKEKIGSGLTTIIVQGSVGNVKAAIEAGSLAAANVGEVLSVHVIPRPSDSIEKIIRR